MIKRITLALAITATAAIALSACGSSSDSGVSTSRSTATTVVAAPGTTEAPVPTTEAPTTTVFQIPDTLPTPTTEAEPADTGESDTNMDSNDYFLSESERTLIASVISDDPLAVATYLAVPTAQAESLGQAECDFIASGGATFAYLMTSMADSFSVPLSTGGSLATAFAAPICIDLYSALLASS